jgi:hypothetical protein
MYRLWNITLGTIHVCTPIGLYCKKGINLIRDLDKEIRLIYINMEEKGVKLGVKQNKKRLKKLISSNLSLSVCADNRTRTYTPCGTRS